MLTHPGGKDIILAHAGTDATEKFIEFGHLTKGRIIEVLTTFRLGKYK
jgi:cytochrome b involved in lipid metabolism